MIQNEIYIGSLTEPLFYFNNVNMEAATGRLAVDLVGNELSVDGKALIEVRSYKIIEVPENPPFPSSIDVLTDPPLSTVVQFVYEIR